MEIALAIAGLLLAPLFYWRGRKDGSRTEAAIRDDISQVPAHTAEVVHSMLETIPRSIDPAQEDRGWDSEMPATVGFARLFGLDGDRAILIEFAYGAHSAVLLVLDDDPLLDDVRARMRVRGKALNGTGARFKIREASDGAGDEVVTLDYAEPLLEERSLAEMPVQPVYYRHNGDDLVEVGRGEVFDPHEPWWIPASVEPFLDQDWVRKQRDAD